MADRGRGAALRALMGSLALLLMVGGPTHGRRLLDGGDATNHGCKPEQIHLAATGNPTEIRASWKTVGEGCQSKVEYAPGNDLEAAAAANALLSTDESSVETYSNHDMCASPARDYSYEPLYLHSVVMTGLTPGATYAYRIAHGSAITFRAMPRTGPRHSFTFIVYGDMGESEHARAKSPGAADNAREVGKEVERGAEMVLHVGDISYANGHPAVWETFMGYIEPFASKVPYMVAIGNHEYDYRRGSRNEPDISGEDEPYSPDWGNFGNDSGGECGVAASKRFPMPDVPDLGYWADAGNTRNLSSNPTLRRRSSSGGGGSSSSSESSSGGSSSSSSSESSSSDSATSGASAALEAEAAAEQHGGEGTAISRRAAMELPPLVLPQHAGQQQQGEESMLSMAGVLSDASEVAPSDRNSPSSSSSSSVGRHRMKGKPNPPFWYSYSHGPVHVTVISTEHDLGPKSEQYAWIKSDLQRVDRCRTPWLLVAMHRPQYVVYPHKSNRIVGEHLREHVEDLFNQYEVDLVLSGHMHSYSRTCNVLAERCIRPEEGGMTHITVGTGGKKLSDVQHDQEEWLEFAASKWGYGRITVHDGFSLTWEFVTTADGNVLDATKIYNSRASMRACNYDAYD